MSIFIAKDSMCSKLLFYNIRFYKIYNYMKNITEGAAAFLKIENYIDWIDGIIEKYD